MTADKLRSLTQKELAQMAKERAIPGWHSMRKADLVKALARLPKLRRKPVARTSAVSRRSSGHSRPAAAAPKRVAPRKASVAISAASSKGTAPKKSNRNSRVKRAIAKNRVRLDLSKGSTVPGAKDRLVVMVRDPFWLHAFWELTRNSVERAKAAMGQHWHAAKPVLRLYRVSSNGTTSTAATLVRNVEIHGGVNNWYLDVNEPPKSFRVDIGYLSDDDRFFLLARSNVVNTPKAGASDSIDENWNDVAANFDKIYAINGGHSAQGPSAELKELFEERLRRPMGQPLIGRDLNADGAARKNQSKFSFEVDAEIIVYGSTEPGAQVTLQGQPVRLRPDGSFTVRYTMPNCRQVIPAVARSVDGIEQRTIILAIERNTKRMEPVIFTADD